MDVNIKVLADVNLQKYAAVTTTVMTGFANEVMAALKIDNPRPPAQGAMVFKSERQRRFVMAAMKRGQITVPYVRASTKTIGSAHLQASYRLNNNGDEVQLVSDAPYAQYVVGDQQAAIHQGRWKVANDAVKEVIDTGTLDALVKLAIADLEI